jgi:hypothetical protein
MNNSSVFQGTKASCWHVEDICIDLWSWFHCSPVRKEDFIKIADDLNEAVEKNILYFVATRWVLLGKVIDRVLGKSISLISFNIYQRYFFFYSSMGNFKRVLSCVFTCK